MRRRGWTFAALAALTALFTVGMTAGASSAPDVPSRCFVTAGATAEGENFGGHLAAHRDRETVEGQWTHRTADGRTLRGQADWLTCRRATGDAGRPHVEVDVADFGGHGTFDGRAVDFAVKADDEGEPGQDNYALVVSPRGEPDPIYTASAVVDGGNIQIHAANPAHP